MLPFYRTLERQADVIFSRYGTTVFLPSVDTCFSDAAGTTPAVVDGHVGKMICSRGTALYADQSSGTAQPILRKGTVTGGVSDGVGPYWLEFDGTDYLWLSAVPWTTGTQPAFVSAVAKKADTGVLRCLFGLANSGTSTPYESFMIATNNLCSSINRSDDNVTYNRTANYPTITTNTPFVATCYYTATKVFARSFSYSSIAADRLSPTTTNRAAIGLSPRPTLVNYWLGGIYGMALGACEITGAELRIVEMYLAVQAGTTV